MIDFKETLAVIEAEKNNRKGHGGADGEQSGENADLGGEWPASHADSWKR
jgi:hypothetical protein